MLGSATTVQFNYIAHATTIRYICFSILFSQLTLEYFELQWYLGATYPLLPFTLQRLNFSNLENITENKMFPEKSKTW